MQTDVLILGSGIGGLSTAIQIAMRRPDLKITVLTKTQEGESNTRCCRIPLYQRVNRIRLCG